MSRTSRYKAVYFGIVIGGVLILLWAKRHFHLTSESFLIIILVCLVPGRILGFFWRDLLRGLRLLNLKQYRESKECSERFLATYAKQPWIRHFLWLGTSSYSRDPRVLALNNLGAAEIGLGEIDQARAHLKEAMEADPECPLPYFNMSFISEDPEEARHLLEQAADRGYTKGVSDMVVSSSQRRFATTR